MLRALFTGISGLTAHQQMLDVTANNIANVNTTGFKSSRTVFQDTLSQTVQGAAGARTAPVQTGGTNSIQIGLGVKLAGTEMNMGQGANQATGVGTDLMIAGDGFFAVQKAGQVTYTRSGAFHLDTEGHLVTSDGAIVLGLNGPGATAADNPLDLKKLIDGSNGSDGKPYVSYNIGPDGVVNGVTQGGAIDALGTVALATFPNPNGLQKVGDSQYATSPSSGAPIIGAPGDGAHGQLNAGYLEMSNVDLSAELTNLIIAQRGFQANSKSVTTADQILQTLVTLKQ